MTPPPVPLPIRRRRLAWRRDMVLLDYAILILGAVSVLIFILSIGNLDPAERQWLRYVDYATIFAFGLSYLGKLLVTPDHLAWFRRNWFSLVGLLPLTQAVLVPDRFYTVVQVIVVLSRFSQALDQAFGERILEQIFARYRAAIVEELTDPILDRLVVILDENLSRGTYTASIGQSLEEERYKVRAAVAKGIERSPKLQMFLRLPGLDRRKDELVEELVDATVATLTSDELNTLIQNSIHRAFTDLRRQIREDRRWREKGIGVGELATGFMRAEDRDRR